VNNKGTVFEVSAGYCSISEVNGYCTIPDTLATFNGSNGDTPYAGLLEDKYGNLFGATEFGGSGCDGIGCGTVFEVENTDDGYYARTLIDFAGADGYNPAGSLIADTNGDVFGTTTFGGTAGAGTVFEITDSGFGVTVPEPSPSGFGGGAEWASGM
jgi:hypothetical protein